MWKNLVGMILTFTVATSAIAAPDVKKPAPADDSARIAERLLDRMDIEKRIARAPLQEVIDLVQQKSELTILIDGKALMDAGVADNSEAIDSIPISLAPMKNVRIETVLRLIAEQFGADYYIAPDHVRLTSTKVKYLLTGQPRPLPNLYPAQNTEDMLQVDVGEIVRTTPYVTVTFTDVSVSEALRDVAARAGRNVVISAQAVEKSQTPVTVRLSNVAFETAAATLAESAGLRAFRTGNVVVIVTPDRAMEVQGDNSPRIALGGLGGLGGGGAMLTLAELESVSRLFSNPAETEKKRKELEEKIQKLTEELQSAKKKQ